MVRLKVGILSNQRGWHLEDLFRAGRKLDLEVAALDFRSLATAVEEGREEVAAGSQPLAEFDRLLVRAMPPGSLEQVVFRMDVLQRLVARGIPVINSPRAVECAVDKYLALARLSAAGLPVPRTRACEGARQALEDFEALGGDVVVKPLFGSEGRGLMRISDPDLALRAFHALERAGAVIYQQQFIRHPGWDLRVLVLGERVCAAMRRRVAPPFTSGAVPNLAGAEWRTNIARGGRGEPADLSKEAAELAIQAAAAVGTEIAGVDLLPDAQGNLYAIEVNSSPGWQALSRVTGADVAAEVLGYLRDLLPPGAGQRNPRP
ncbi:MAG: RimK family alpha-L-glutamate ligase [Planctomycetes bacterium]|nr:RimK family alpha-L-glutamate ligase [Planctomycetota bacterium]